MLTIIDGTTYICTDDSKDGAEEEDSLDHADTDHANTAVTGWVAEKSVLNWVDTSVVIGEVPFNLI